MAKKRSKNEQVEAAKAELTELNADDVDKLAAGIEEIVGRLRTVAKNMRNDELKIHSKGMATWPKIRARLSGAARSIEIAWDKANIPLQVQSRRKKKGSASE